MVKNTSTYISIIGRVFVHITVLVVAYGYMVLGGYWFCLIEGWESDEKRRVNYTEKLDSLKLQTWQAVKEFGSVNESAFYYDLDVIVETAINSTKPETNGWNLLDGFLYAFSTVTTIGYGHLITATAGGRIFYVFYGIIGIPLFTLAMADLGLFMEKFMTYLYVKILHLLSNKCGICHSWSSSRRYLVPAESMLALPIVLTIFTLYTALGGLLFPLWETQWGFVEAFYVAFDTITTIGIGDIYPKNNDWFLASMLYESIGIAIGCVTIGALSDYIRIVHHFGTQPSDCGQEVVWFGGKHMRVNELVSVLGKEFGATEHEIRSVQHKLDRVVNEAFVERRRSRQFRNSYRGSGDSYFDYVKPMNYRAVPEQPDFYKGNDNELKAETLKHYD